MFFKRDRLKKMHELSQVKETEAKNKQKNTMTKNVRWEI